MGLDMFLFKTIKDEAPDWENGNYEEVGYWRKFNALHAWFVKHVQDGQDDCEPYLVSKEKLDAIITVLGYVDENPRKAQRLLPTEAGFFFGNTDYDEWYKHDVKQALADLKEVLEETDFTTHNLYYVSSW